MQNLSEVPSMKEKKILYSTLTLDTDLLREQPDYPEFIYLQPGKASSSAFDPYDLDIVSHSEISSPYFYTMSSQGVTLYRDHDAG
jgi:hypothetical protein